MSKLRSLASRAKGSLKRGLRRTANIITGDSFTRIERLARETQTLTDHNRRTLRKIRNALQEKTPPVSNETTGLSSPAGITSSARRRLSRGAARDEDVRLELSAAYMASDAYRKMLSLKDAYKGRRAFIIGNGPSLNNQDLLPLRDEITFCTNWFLNHPNYDAISPTFHTVSSHEMFGGWNNPSPELNRDWYEKSRVLTKNTTKVFPFRFQPYVEGNDLYPDGECQYLIFDRPKELMDEKGAINLDISKPMVDGYTGILTFCIPLAHHLGITEIYLLGCDADYGLTTPDADKKYFYDYSQHTSRTSKFESLNRIWAVGGPVFQAYTVARDQLAREGVAIYNATHGGRLEVFERVALESVLERPVATGS